MLLDSITLNKYVEFSKFTVEKHSTEDLYIYGYDLSKEGNPIIWDAVNLHMRGLITNRKGKVIAKPFPKFFTFDKYITKTKVLTTEGVVLTLPNEDFEIYEKADGSMATMYWIKNHPFMASQRSFSSANARKANKILSDKYPDVNKLLDKNLTYIFEAIYTETQVNIDYGAEEKLVLLGAVNTLTGKEIALDKLATPFPKVNNYTKRYKHITDLEKLRDLDLPGHEGFVLRYANGLRIKIKFPWYTESHRLLNRIIRLNKLCQDCKRAYIKAMKINQNEFTDWHIWDHLKSGKDIDVLTCAVPADFYAYGFEEWLNHKLSNFHNSISVIKGSNNQLSNEDLWSAIEPKEPEIFSVEKRKHSTEYSTPMWGLVNRIKKEFV